MSDAMVGNAADRDQVKEAAGKEKRRDDRDAEDLRHVMGSVQGRRVVWRLLNRYGLYRPSFNASSLTDFREGERNAALFLFHEISAHTPDEMLRMMTEARHEETNPRR